MFRYSNLTVSGEQALVFSSNSADANRTGVYLNSTTAGQPTGIWNTSSDYTTTQNRNIMTSALSAGVFAFQYREGTGDTGSNGTSLYVLTNGGPFHATEVPSTLMINMLFERNRYGMGSTIAVMMIALCFAFAIIISAAFKEREYYGKNLL